MTDLHVRNVLEAALLAAGRSLTLDDLAQVFEDSSRPDNAVLREALDALIADYQPRGIEIKETAADSACR